MDLNNNQRHYFMNKQNYLNTSMTLDIEEENKPYFAQNKIFAIRKKSISPMALHMLHKCKI